ncbi:MAG: 5-(carboxyamino)imidazole ribonucleotide synthase [Phormidesmis sp.]
MAAAQEADMAIEQAQRVGVIGGGQLAWMMAAGAKLLGIELAVQTPKPDDPACSIAQKIFLGAIADANITKEMAAACEIITFENEFIDLPALRSLTQTGTTFYPQLDCLAPLLDKYDQRQYCTQIGLPSPTFETLTEKADLSTLPEKVKAVGLPLALKTRRHGYDGQGTFILKTLEAVETTWKALGYQPVLLEAFVPFEKELAVMVARDRTGEVAVYPVVETQQIEQVCRRVIAPARVAQTVVDEVNAIARKLVNSLGVVGIFGIELFLTQGGKVLINEIAPRTHNSGHYTLDACVTSQFEQQLRAVSNRPLGSVELTGKGAVMINLLGTEEAKSDYADKRAALAQIPNSCVYWYGKKQSRIGRKLGHVTILSDTSTDGADLDNLIAAVERLWY